MIQNLAIKSWAEDDRPREKLMLKGRNALSDSELLAILLGSGTKSKTAVELAQEMLFCSGNSLAAFGKISLKDLIKFKGIGEAKALTILAALEFGRRSKENDLPKRKIIRCAADSYELLYPYLKDLTHEEFYIILLSRKNEVLHFEQMSKGGSAGTVVDGKLIFKKAFDYLASSIILMHNHPSGQLFPSSQDEKLTEKIVEFGKMIDLPVLDHIIFTDNGYFSFAEQGILR